MYKICRCLGVICTKANYEMVDSELLYFSLQDAVTKLYISKNPITTLRNALWLELQHLHWYSHILSW